MAMTEAEYNKLWWKNFGLWLIELAFAVAFTAFLAWTKGVFS
jgi:hypothetical protein